MIDLDIFDAGVKSIYDFGDDDLMPHFIYCGVDKNEKIWNSIINTDNAKHGESESGDKRNSQKSSRRKIKK